MSLWQKAVRRLRGLMMRRLPLMITCREFDDFIVDYLEGALAPAQRSLFERHLWFCRDCRAYLDRYRRTLEIGRRVCLEPGEAVPVDVPEDLVRAVLAAAEAEDEK